MGCVKNRRQITAFNVNRSVDRGGLLGQASTLIDGGGRWSGTWDAGREGGDWGPQRSAHVFQVRTNNGPNRSRKQWHSIRRSNPEYWRGITEPSCGVFAKTNKREYFRWEREDDGDSTCAEELEKESREGCPLECYRLHTRVPAPELCDGLAKRTVWDQVPGLESQYPAKLVTAGISLSHCC